MQSISVTQNANVAQGATKPNRYEYLFCKEKAFDQRFEWHPSCSHTSGQRNAVNSTIQALRDRQDPKQPAAGNPALAALMRGVPKKGSGIVLLNRNPPRPTASCAARVTSGAGVRKQKKGAPLLDCNPFPCGTRQKKGDPHPETKDRGHPKRAVSRVGTQLTRPAIL